MEAIIPQNVVERLSRYRSVLMRLKSLGFARVFSDNLADALGVSASLVRKDLGLHGIRGAKRGGYNIDALLDHLTNVLGVSGNLKLVVVGCGHIGSALLRTYGGKRHGVNAIAGFDINPQVINPHAAIPIHDIHDLPQFVAQHGVSVAILSVPEEAAASVMEQIRAARIRGVLNFTPAHLRCDGNCLVQTLDIRMEIEKLFCMVEMAERQERSASNRETSPERENNDN